jgi:WD40 repeat protein
VQGVVFEPSGGAVLGLASVWNEELTVLLRWELATGVAREVRIPATTTTLALLGDEGDDVVLGGEHGLVERWSPRDGARVLAYPPHEGSVLALAVSEDRTRVASAGLDGRVHLADARSGAALDLLDLGLTGDRAHALAFVGTSLVVGTARGLVLELELSPP